MPVLPFVVQPQKQEVRRIGSEKSGIIEMPVLGGITVGEAAAIGEYLANTRSSFVKASQAADAIAKAEDISISEAYTIIDKKISREEQEPECEEIAKRHLELIEEVGGVYQLSGQMNMEATVTAMIRYRLKIAEWGLEQTRTLHQDLFDGIWALARQEQGKEPADTTPPSEEDLGKQPEASGAKAKRTGS